MISSKIWKDAVGSFSKYYPSIRLKELRIYTEKLKQNSRSVGRESNPGLQNISRSFNYSTMHSVEYM
jgi:hypothetical protein